MHDSASVNPLAQKQSAGSLIRFALPSVATMVFMGLYTVVDVVFVARLVSPDAMASINIATPAIKPYCMDYMAIILAFTPASVLQVLFQNAVIAAGRPGVGTAMAVVCGLSNIAFDYLFLAVMGLGISGAAWGTVTGYTVAALMGFAFFASRKGGLRFAKPSRDLKVIAKSCGNGASEMVSQAAAAVTTFLFNAAMLSLAEEAGVAAVTIVIYAQFLVASLFIGFSMGTAPVISYDYGSGDKAALSNVFRSCLKCIAVASVAACILAFLLAPVLSALFAEPGSPVFSLASAGLAIFSTSFLFSGLNTFASAAFTALSNGRLSALVSFLRTFGLVPLCILLLPRLLGIDGVWMAVPIAEAVTFALAATLLFCNGNRYGYRSQEVVGAADRTAHGN